MSQVLKGIEVARAYKEKLSEQVLNYKSRGITPALCIVRVGNREDDLAYERAAIKRMNLVGIDSKVIECPENISQGEFEKVIDEINEDKTCHGVLMFSPLPKTLDEEVIKRRLDPLKDIDGLNPVNAGKVYMGDPSGFAPCTAEAVVEILKHFEVNLEGKNVVVVGRSLVVGKPLSMLLLGENATVSICHSRTQNMREMTQRADIIIAAVGRSQMIDKTYVGPQTIAIDVGINVDEEGKMTGDINFESVNETVKAITPVPGGVGSVTTTILAKHVLKAVSLLEKEGRI